MVAVTAFSSPSGLPPPQGDQPENLARLAAQLDVPLAQCIKVQRRGRVTAWYLARYRDLFLAAGLAIVSSVLPYEAQQSHAFLFAINTTGAAAAAFFAAALWLVYR